MWRIRKRGKTYQVDVSVNGRRVRKSAGTVDKKSAEQIARKIEQEMIQQITLGEKPVYLWQDAVVRWAKETERKSFFGTDRPRLRAIDKHLRDVNLEEINASMVWKVVNSISDEKDLTHSTQNKYMGLIRAILNAARAWEWIDHVPVLKSKSEPKRRVRWITKGEAKRLIEALPEPHRNPVRFALSTGLRKSNVYYMEWSQVDLQRKIAWIYGDQAKAGKDIRVPLNQSAIAVLRNQIGSDIKRIFPNAPINNSAWRNSCKRAGISDFRFHDLRHTWASWHVMNGTTLQELMELGGWSEYSMVLKYAHLSDNHLNDASENIGTNLSHDSFFQSAISGESL